MRISIITKDKYLFRLFEIRLTARAITVMGIDKDADTVVYDCDSGEELPKTDAKLIKVSRSFKSDALKLPLPPSFFDELVSQKNSTPPLSLSSDGRRATVHGRAVKLTALEYSLLSLLISGGENYTSRSEISRKVWDGASDGLVNVYIHYLREKLETDGEKIIISSRKYGYKINPLYIDPSRAYTEKKTEKGAEA